MTATNNATAIHTSLPLSPLTIYTLTDSCESRLPEAHRLCEIGWRLTEKQEASGMKKKPSVCIAIPKIELNLTSPSELADTVQDCFEKMQDAIIAKWLKALIAANTAYNYLGTKLPLAYTLPYGIAEIYETTEAKGKLSADSVKLWFDNCLSEQIATLFLTKNPEADLPEVAAKVERYKAAIASLTSSKTVLQKAQAEMLQRAVNEAIDGRIKLTLSAKLNSFINPPKVEELEELI